MKKVDITGTHNRYQIKKVTRTTADINKPRVATIGWDASLYSTEVQMVLLNELHTFLSNSITQENKQTIPAYLIRVFLYISINLGVHIH